MCGSVLSEKYLRVLQEMFECRDNDLFNLLQTDLQDVLRFEGVRPNSDSFIERYIRGKASLYVITSVKGNLIGNWDFCTVLESAHCRNSAESIGVRNFVVDSNSGQYDVKVSVSVDVRQFAQNTKSVTDSCPWPTTVRLYSLDESISRIGDAGQLLFKDFFRHRDVIGDGRIPVSRYLEHQGELTVPLPILRKGYVSGIELDEFERQMIERRTELIDDLANNHQNVSRCSDTEIDVFLTIRIFDDFIRVCFAKSLSEITVDLQKVYRCPDDFVLSRLDSTDLELKGHKQSITSYARDITG